MSIGGDDGITLPKMTKCADIKRKKNRHMAYRHRGVFYVVIVERIQDLNSLKQCCRSEMFIPDPRCLSRIRDVYPGSKFFHP
jgi:hypothetical protein